MLEKMRYYYQIIIVFLRLPFLRLSKNLFDLTLCLMLCFSFPTFAGKEPPEVVEKIRSALSVKFNKAGQKGKVAKTVGVAAQTLEKFIKKESIKDSTASKIVDAFKKEYGTEYTEFTIIPSSTPSLPQVKESAPSSQAESVKTYTVLDLSTLPFHTSYPDTYSLFMVDSSLIPSALTASWEQHADFKNIGSRFLRPTLAADKDLSFAGTEEEARGKHLNLSFAQDHPVK